MGGKAAGEGTSGRQCKSGGDVHGCGTYTSSLPGSHEFWGLGQTKQHVVKFVSWRDKPHSYRKHGLERKKW